MKACRVASLASTGWPAGSSPTSQGKFWTIFSLLFGMGFAVMMTRAARAGREFTKVYLRRMLALAVFGAAHFILLWEGDILFSYAVGALMLMIVLYGKTTASS